LNISDKACLPRTLFGMLLYRMSKMVSECVDYDSDRERIVFEIHSDYFRFKSVESVLPIIPMIDYFLSDCPSLQCTVFSVVILIEYMFINNADLQFIAQYV
jgi:hypothetical protein